MVENPVHWVKDEWISGFDCIILIVAAETSGVTPIGQFSKYASSPLDSSKQFSQ
jgi:hypothetical protein